MSIYDYKAIDIKGNERSLSEFKGKSLLIVNTASKCGFTPQYEGLQKIYDKYKDKLEVLAFPCNQFGKQEPGNSEDIQSFCDLTFKTSFPLFEKVEVNGENTHPLFQYLKSELPGLLGSKKIKWNFTKFLIDSEGNPVKRYAPIDKPESIENDIKKSFK
ncbi:MULTISPECIES: glutathione peroxidase [Halobacteriovorax]|uniref:Glutathione peroxidase n=1 Tax=Halobacteriovorax vibrionivorans TaxID=2152716 RepID=A0ABY0IBP1_9BACT|nr:MULTISPECIES: glutathione peroxidase [Halobacteriovorax]AYF44378.1 glutathione peroxidase [Halobacteriovorax sp. BALOs_7]RZF20380.1 glutathione peroxidase [Halobacteriovorax vibrionivorans]TGD46553.1 glutathione peroxidase [Halobacteriovorax sp. Y22]